MTDLITILAPQNQDIGEFYVVQNVVRRILRLQICEKVCQEIFLVCDCEGQANLIFYFVEYARFSLNYIKLIQNWSKLAFFFKLYLPFRTHL